MMKWLTMPKIAGMLRLKHLTVGLKLLAMPIDHALIFLDTLKSQRLNLLLQDYYLNQNLLNLLKLTLIKRILVKSISKTRNP
jgi:hypothetical protein